MAGVVRMVAAGGAAAAAIVPVGIAVFVARLGVFGGGTMVFGGAACSLEGDVWMLFAGGVGDGRVIT